MNRPPGPPAGPSSPPPPPKPREVTLTAAAALIAVGVLILTIHYCAPVLLLAALPSRQWRDAALAINAKERGHDGNHH